MLSKVRPKKDGKNRHSPKMLNFGASKPGVVWGVGAGGLGHPGCAPQIVAEKSLG